MKEAAALVLLTALFCAGFVRQLDHELEHTGTPPNKERQK